MLRAQMTVIQLLKTLWNPNFMTVIEPQAKLIQFPHAFISTF
jgi:hypothetical protein